MNNKTLIFEKNGLHWAQKCGPDYLLSEDCIISIMNAAGWTLVKVLG